MGKSIRWDLGAIDELPSHLRIVIQSIVDTMEDIKGEMKPRGRSCSVQYTVEEVSQPICGLMRYWLNI